MAHSTCHLKKRNRILFKSLKKFLKILIYVEYDTIKEILGSQEIWDSFVNKYFFKNEKEIGISNKSLQNKFIFKILLFTYNNLMYY